MTDAAVIAGEIEEKPPLGENETSGVKSSESDSFPELKDCGRITLDGS